MSKLENIQNEKNLPRHVAIIMDGNGRWAQQQGKDRSFGHREGIEAVKRTVEGCGEAGIEYLTLYTFSMENWNRPKEEVNILMALMVDAIVREKEELMKQKVCVQAIGDMSALPEPVYVSFRGLMDATADNTGVKLVLALSYGSRWEISNAAKRLVEDFQEGKIKDVSRIDEGLFSSYLMTKDIPDPDLLIRTGGESRLSNFLLWQCAYTEFYFMEKFWPDFGKDDLYLAVLNFMQRERRFGKTGEQVSEEAI